MDFPLILSADGSRAGALLAALREAILSGRLAAGARLPPSRALAAQLGVSRGIVVSAYEELTSEGYCVARVGAGTFVGIARSSPGSPPPASPPRLSAWGERLGAGRPDAGVAGPFRFDFRSGVAPEEFPGPSLTRAVRHAAARLATSAGAGEPAGSVRLRRALLAHLARTRGLRADTSRVVVVNGSQQGLDLAARLLLDPGDRVCIEEPGYPRARRVLEALGARLLPIPVDGGGLITGALPADGARLLYVTPSHQYPTGAVLAPERRLALLDWAERHRAWVVEDDYDSEFRYDGPPLPSLQGLDRGERCLYLGSLSKLLHPGLRAGYLVVPASLVSATVAAKGTLDMATTPLIQEALADLFESGQIERHLRRASRAYRARRAHLLAALAKTPLPGARVWPVTGGLHVYVELADVPPAVLYHQAARFDLALVDASECYATRPVGTQLILWFGRIAPAEIAPGVAALAAAVATARNGAEEMAHAQTG